MTKTSSVIWDPINLFGAGRKAIPAAIMQYQILVVNSGSSSATLQNISDPVPAQTLFLQGNFPGSRDVEIQVGAAAATYCIAEAAGVMNVVGVGRPARLVGLEARPPKFAN